jgi:DNA-binding CsgD family transcriptional regulator
MSKTAALQLAVEVARLAARGLDYERLLLDETHNMLSADAGVGLFKVATGAGAGVSVDVGGRDITCAGSAWRCGRCVACRPPDQQKLVLQAVARHPVIGIMARDLSVLPPLRVSDVTSMRAFWGTEAYEVVHGYIGARYPASCVLYRDRERLVFLGVQREGRDFSDREMEALALIQRPLATAIAFRNALDDSVAELRKADREATVRSFHPGTSAEVTTMFVEYQPTTREAEVLSLVAMGWTSQRIARRLGITERTVRKHLGAVYEKAGVKGRAAAAAWWRDRSISAL